jgi:hypothetical protein
MHLTEPHPSKTVELLPDFWRQPNTVSWTQINYVINLDSDTADQPGFQVERSGSHPKEQRNGKIVITLNGWHQNG